MVGCFACGQPVDWITAHQAADVMKVSGPLVRRWISEGRFPNAQKFAPGNGARPFWKLPLSEVAAVMRERTQNGS